jgi:hypothetical protein
VRVEFETTFSNTMARANPQSAAAHIHTGSTLPFPRLTTPRDREANAPLSRHNTPSLFTSITFQTLS